MLSHGISPSSIVSPMPKWNPAMPSIAGRRIGSWSGGGSGRSSISGSTYSAGKVSAVSSRQSPSCRSTIAAIGWRAR